MISILTNVFIDRSYVVMAAKLFRPNSVYRLTVFVPPESHLQVLQVRASIVIRSNQQNKIQQVTSAADVIVDIGASGNLIMKVKIENKINSLNKKRIWP